MLIEGRADKRQDVSLSTHKMSAIPNNTVDHRTIAVANRLSDRLGCERFEMWFGTRDAICVEQAADSPPRLRVQAPNLFSLNRLQATFGQEIKQVAYQVCGPHLEIVYQIQSPSDSPSDTPSNSPSNSLNELGDLTQNGSKISGGNSVPVFNSVPATPSLRSEKTGGVQAGDAASARHIRARQTETSPASTEEPTKPVPKGLKTFWFGKENRLAGAAVDQIFEYPGQFTPLLVYGPTGSGKTHLLEAIANDFRRRLRRTRSVMVSAEEFTSQFVASLRGSTGLPMFRRKFRDLDMLVIDDIQFFAGKRATVNEFQHTVENLLRAGKQVVLSSDRPPLELCALGGDLGNRLSAGLSCPLRYPELEGRMQIARRFCNERKLQLPADVLEMICTRLSKDDRRISGALNRLYAYVLATDSSEAPHSGITMEVALDQLKDLFSVHNSQASTLRNIESAVCDVCGVKPSDLKSSSRLKQISTARMLAMYLSRRYTSAAYSEIGDYFGGRSHSTVIAAQKKVTSWLQQNSGLKLPMATYEAQDLIDRLENTLRVG